MTSWDVIPVHFYGPSFAVERRISTNIQRTGTIVAETLTSPPSLIGEDCVSGSSGTCEKARKMIQGGKWLVDWATPATGGHGSLFQRQPYVAGTAVPTIYTTATHGLHAFLNSSQPRLEYLHSGFHDRTTRACFLCWDSPTTKKESLSHCWSFSPHLAR